MNRHFIISVLVSALIGTETFAQNEGKNWTATDNATLYSQMLTFLDGFQRDFAGEQTGYMLQDAMMRIKAAHQADQYEWISQVYDLCINLEAVYPAFVSNPNGGSGDRYEKIRRGILRLWDFPAHVCSSSNADDKISPPAEQSKKYSEASIAHVQLKRDQVLDFLDTPRPSDNQMQLVKVYSSGFILRTKNACIAFDICYNYAFASEDRMYDLIAKLDAVFYTHVHNDHYDGIFAEKMLDAGKVVVLPKDFLPGKTVANKIVWPGGQASLIDIVSGVRGCAQMAKQGSDDCLLYYVDMDGWRIIHNGDNDDHSKCVFFETKDRADIIFCDLFGGFTNYMTHFMKAPNPSNISTTYVTTHENEWHHTVYRRIGYHYNFFHSSALGNTAYAYPNYIGMDNGEHIVITKKSAQ